MKFLLEIQRQPFGTLRLDGGTILSEDAVLKGSQLRVALVDRIVERSSRLVSSADRDLMGKPKVARVFLHRICHNGMPTIAAGTDRTRPTKRSTRICRRCPCCCSAGA
ncbi:hypothetical protein Pan216_15380 [Planctomycetes bacterium Pan216]|uniref:Uncharacterized protein n=1 Tax=Kolteria novifilia TaxID=2527975 RepID=A0A518B141_9BACT|nr:hypothetical protein Pan216_15380 [Planctomycetes bacterium Pan216]